MWNFMDFLTNIALGPNGGLKKKTLIEFGRRYKFSDFCRFRVYDPKTCTYINNDNTLGYMWECSSLVYAGEDVFSILAGCLNIGVPEHTVLDVFLHADPYIEDFLDHYINHSRIDNDLCRKSVESIAEFYRDGATHGVSNCLGVPIRKFRLYISLKMPSSEFGLDEKALTDLDLFDSVLGSPALLNIRDSVMEILKGAKLFPRYFEPNQLIRMLSRIFNDRDFHGIDQMYNETIPINKQVIMAETRIKVFNDYIRSGQKTFMCLTPKQLPMESYPMLLNYCLGGIKGVEDDSNQIHAPFFANVKIVFENMKTMLHNKCNTALMQQNWGSFALAQQRRKDEYTWATGEIERGTNFLRIIPSIWIYSEDENKCREATARTKRLFEQFGFVMQNEIAILPLLFISSLPMGLMCDKNFLSLLDRDFILHAPSVVNFMPIQGDFSGGPDPVMPFMGRKGEAISFDVFNKAANSYNMMIAAGTGKGKSFLSQYIILNYYRTGSYIRIIDIGGSYERICKILDGKYLSFSMNSGIVLNPFTNIKEEEFNDDLDMLANIVQQMAFASSRTIPDGAILIIKEACRWAYENEGPDAMIDHVSQYLREYPKQKSHTSYVFDAENSQATLNRYKDLAHSLSFNLSEFTSRGTYGRFFNGRSTLDIAHDPFVVLEMEELSQMQALFSTVVLQVLNYITYDVYMSDRSTQRFIIFDEAWKFLSNNKGNGNESLISSVISEGYRRARKYSASFSTIFQSLRDLEGFGDVGDVIFANSEFKFLLESKDFEKAREAKRVDYDTFTMDILKSVKTPKPRYSEIFLDTPFGSGVARLLIDPFNYFLFTSDGVEKKQIDDLVESGMSYAEAIESMAAKARKVQTSSRKVA